MNVIHTRGAHADSHEPLEALLHALAHLDCAPSEKNKFQELVVAIFSKMKIERAWEDKDLRKENSCSYIIQLKNDYTVPSHIIWGTSKLIEYQKVYFPQTLMMEITDSTISFGSNKPGKIVQTPLEESRYCCLKAVSSWWQVELSKDRKQYQFAMPYTIKTPLITLGGTPNIKYFACDEFLDVWLSRDKFESIGRSS